MGERIIFSMNGATTLDILTLKNKVGPFAYIIHKNQLQMDYIPKKRAKTIKLLEEGV